MFLSRKSFGFSHSFRALWTCSLCSSCFSKESSLNSHLGHIHAPTLSLTLRQNPLETYLHIFGPNYKSLHSKELRYSNGLVIKLEGSHYGLWYSFSENKGGGPLKALQFTNPNHSFHQIIKDACSMSDITSEELRNDIPCKPRDHNTLDSLRQRIQFAKQLWELSVPINESHEIAFHYLVKIRKIPRDTIHKCEFRFLEKKTEYYNNTEGRLVDNKFPSLIVPIVNLKKEIRGIQKILLFPHGKVRKYSNGQLRNCAGLIQQGLDRENIFVCEGPETGASLAAAYPSSTVLASLSVCNIKSVLPVLLAYEPKMVILAGDNDGNEKRVTRERTLEASYLYSQKIPSVKTVFPALLSGFTSTDWNDVLRVQGVESIRNQINV